MLDIRQLEIVSTRDGEVLAHLPGLVVQPGEIVGLVGPSGAGKTLIGLAIMGLLPEGVRVSRGRIVFQGMDLLTARESTLNQIRGDRLAMVFQEPLSALNPVQRCGDQLELALRLAGCGSRERMGKAVAALREAGIEAPEATMRAFPAELSGGQRQRVMVALATVRAPSLLVADEPTTALDPPLKLEFVRRIKQLRDDRGLSTLLNSHDEGLVRACASRVVQVGEGHSRVMSLPGCGRSSAFDAGPLLTLAVSDLHKSFGRGRRLRHALRGITFELHAGEFLGVVGRSGSGKTTLARCVSGLCAPDRGVIQHHGRDPRSQPVHDPGVVQLVFQDPYASLDPKYSVERSIAEPLTRGAPLTQAIADRVSELLEQVGLSQALRSRRPAALSGGQRQRVAIARALAASPQLLIADEPTAALDSRSAFQLLELLCRLREHHPFACMVISHDFSVVAALCERVIVLHEGSIVDRGTIEGLSERSSERETSRLVQAALALRPSSWQPRADD